MPDLSLERADPRRIETVASLLRRVLIVSPHFPPTNAADHHRVRLALPHFAEHGWEAEVLAVRPEAIESVPDPDLGKSLPAGSVVHRVSAVPFRWTRRFSCGNLAARAYWSLRFRGDTLLATGRFDLVFFSTTQFGVLRLAPYWQRRYAVPYVLDFQDEWVSSYYRRHPRHPRPGGRLKYALSQWRARWQERAVVRGAAQIVSVSTAYHRSLRRRHPRLARAALHVLPFGGAAADFSFLEKLGSRQTFFAPQDGCTHWVSIGRGGADMLPAVGAFFSALARALEKRLLNADGLRIHFLGTSYAPPEMARKSFNALARAHGLEKIVTEHPQRIPYFTALDCLRSAHAVLVFGSDEGSYAASKIYPAILAERPLLAVVHKRGAAAEVLRALRIGTLVPFASSSPGTKIADRIFSEWFLRRGFECVGKVEVADFAPYSAATMTRHLTRIFDAAMPRCSTC